MNYTSERWSAAEELKKQMAINAELLAALERCEIMLTNLAIDGVRRSPVAEIKIARAAIAKAKAS
jgi:hypothetical protein